MNVETENEIGETLQRLVDANVKGDIPGLILQVKSATLNLDWAGASGRFAHDQAKLLKPTNSFRLASITKTFTAATILLLAEQNRLALDQSIARYLSDEIVEHIHVLNGVSSGSAITIRQLLNHSSGIYDYVQDEKFIEQIRADRHRNWSPLELVQAAIELGSPYALPGSGFFYYSDTNYVLAGLIIEAVTGLALHQAFRQLILTPLQLNQTYFEGSESPWGGGSPARPEISHNYYGSYDLNRFNLSYDWAGGGLVSTAQDLATFLRSVLEGKLLQPNSFTEMTGWVPEAQPGTGNRRRFDRYGLGIGVIKAGGEELIGHSGAWGGFMYYWLPGKATITGTFNASGVDRLPLLAGVIGLLQEVTDTHYK